MTKKKTNLGKRVHMYSGRQEMEAAFSSDVETMGEELAALAEKHFDFMNPWDQTVLMAILTNMLAYVEVLVELDGVNMEKSVKEFYEMNKKDYLQQAKENQQKMN